MLISGSRRHSAPPPIPEVIFGSGSGRKRE